MALELRPYQTADIAEIERLNGRALLSLEMGLGKTVETLAVLARNPSWLPAVVVCPASVKYQWVAEARRHVGFSAAVCEGRTPPKRTGYAFSSPAPLTVINHDILHDWLPWLRETGFKTAVLDEAQNFQNRSAVRTKAARKLAGWAEHVLALSGTPFSNRVSELWSILNIIWPREFPSFVEYAHVYCNPKWTPWGWDYSRAARTDELHARLKSLGMIRHLTEDVAQDLPEKVRCIIPCELSRPAEYEAAAGNFLGWLRQTAPHKVRAAERAAGLAKVGGLLRLAARLKFRGVVDWVNRWLVETDDPAEKITLFAVHRAAIDVLRRRVEAPSVVIDGSVAPKSRQIAIDQFSHDRSTRVLIGQLQAAGVGTNLTAAATSGITELWWRPADLQQAEKRSHRIGQKRTTTINYFVAGGTIEERLCEITQQKQETQSSVMDGGPSGDDLNLFDLLLDEMRSTL